MPAAQVDVLQRAHLVQRDRAGPGDRPPGLDRDDGHVQVGGVAFALDDRAELLGELRDVERDLVGAVRDAEPAAEVQGGEGGERGGPVLVVQRGQEPHHAVRGHLEAAGVEDLAADVAVQPDQRQPLGLEHAPHGLGRVGQREAELLVLVRGGHELVGVRLDPDGQPHHHVRDDASLPGDRIQPGDLVERVEHHPSDARVRGGGELGGRLVVAVQRDPLGREPRAQRDRQLAAAADVEREALLVDPAGHLRAEERLGRVVHRGRPERGRERVCAGTEIGLVDHEQRCAVGLGEVAHVDARDLHDPRRGPDGVARPHGGRERVHLGGAGGARPGGLGRGRDPGVQRPGRVRPHRTPSCAGDSAIRAQQAAHIRSGALTPSIPSPLASTCRAASHSASRARCSSVVSSSPIGSTRQAS